MTTTIRATSRASVKVGDSYYTVEYCEERTVKPDSTTEELEEARQKLWYTCNTECDKQIEDILKMYQKN